MYHSNSSVAILSYGTLTGIFALETKFLPLVRNSTFLPSLVSTQNLTPDPYQLELSDSKVEEISRELSGTTSQLSVTRDELKSTEYKLANALHEIRLFSAAYKHSLCQDV